MGAQNGPLTGMIKSFNLLSPQPDDTTRQSSNRMEESPEVSSGTASPVITSALKQLRQAATTAKAKPQPKPKVRILVRFSVTYNGEFNMKGKCIIKSEIHIKGT